MTTTPDTAVDLRSRAADHLMRTYPEPDLVFVAGRGAALFDPAGRPYLDFLCGLAVTGLGHAHPAVTAAVTAQVERLVHTSNLYLTPPAVHLAERLGRLAGWPDARTFLCQDGATANEAALKLARRWGKQQHPDKIRVVTLEGSFHGRTFATLEATGQPAKHAPFAPLLGVVDTVPFDDPGALAAVVTDGHCAVLLEVVQGEGGVRPVPDEVLTAARRACDDHGALLIADEVQAGVGRCGPWFAWQDSPVVPDVMTLAKALANGLPIGAVVAHGAAATTFRPGDHATTFGGNPVTCAAALAVLDTIEQDGLLASAAARSAQLRDGLQRIVDRVPLAAGTRGRGLLLGLELGRDAAREVEAACRERYLLVNAVAPHVVRLAPPLVVRSDEVELALAVLGDAVAAVG